MNAAEKVTPAEGWKERYTDRAVADRGGAVGGISSAQACDELERAIIGLATRGNGRYTIEDYGRLPQGGTFAAVLSDTAWRNEAGAAWTVLATNNETKERLLAKNVLAFATRHPVSGPWGTVTTERAVVIVNTAWSKDDKALVDWVLGAGPGGWCCRFCGVAEPARDVALVSATRRRIPATGVPTFSRDHVHKECYPYWVDLVSRAAGLSRERLAVLPLEG